MSTVITFDTHRYIKHLTEAGFTEQQAEVLAEEQVLLLNENFATRENLDKVDAGLKTALARVEAELKAELARVEAGLKENIARVEAELKENIAEVRAELTENIAKMEVKIAQSKDELIKWVAGFGSSVLAALMALAGLMVGLLA